MASLGSGGKSKENAPRSAAEGLEMVRCTIQEVDEMKHVSDLIFPIVYRKEFYEKMFTNSIEVYLAKNCALEKSIGIFAVRVIKPTFPWVFGGNDGVTKDHCSVCKCRAGITEEVLERRFVYVIIIGLLESERCKGYGRIMWEKIEEIARKHTMDHIVLHVQVSNLQAIEFYYKLGFKLVTYIKSYYCNIEPKDAFLLRKCLYQPGEIVDL